MPSQTDQLINVQLQQLAAQVANWAAQLDFAKERFRLLEMPQFQHSSQLEIDRLAFDKAQSTWENAYKEASLTGTYQGQPTMEWLTQQAQLTGVLNGQQTLQGKLTDAQITQMNEQMRLANEQFLVQTTGYHQGRPTFEREQWTTGQTGYLDGQSTLARQQMEANLSGYFNGRSTLAREQFQGEQTQNYLQLLASLQSNPFRQLRVLNQTPEGLRSLVNAWAGTYNMPGFGSSGAPGQTQMNELWDPMNFGSAAAPVPPNTGPQGMPGQWGPGGPIPGSATVGGGLPSAPSGMGAAAAAPAGPAPLPGASTAGGSRPISPAEQAMIDAGQSAVGFQAPVSFGPQGPGHDAYMRWLNQGPGATDPWTSQNALAGQWAAMTPEARLAWYGSQAGVTPAMVELLRATGAAAYATPLNGTSPFNLSSQGATDPALTNWAPPGSAAEKEALMAATNNVQVPGYTYSPQGTQAPSGAYNYSATEQGHTQVYPPGVAAPADQEQVSTQTPVNNSTANSLLATPMPGTGGSLAPSQINAYNYNRTNPALQNLMWQYFENEGWDPVAAKGEFMASLPKYAGPTQGKVTI